MVQTQNKNINNSSEIQEESVLKFIRQIVYEKYGTEKDEEFYKKEIDRLYDDYSDNLVSYFKSVIPKEKIEKLQKGIKGEINRDSMLNILMDSVDNLELRIVFFIRKYKEDYLRNISA